LDVLFVITKHLILSLENTPRIINQRWSVDSEITIIYSLFKGWSVRCEMPGQLAVKQGGQLVVKWGGQLIVKYTLGQLNVEFNGQLSRNFNTEMKKFHRCTQNFIRGLF
jgi:hypothetical protein